MLIRELDGTAWYGHVSYNWHGVRKSHLEFKLNESVIPIIEDVYQAYGVCKALYVNTDKFPKTENLDYLYKFLYGYSIEQLMELVDGENPNSFTNHYANEVQEWTIEKVKSIDWDLFCLAFYAFLYSNNDFKCKAWEILIFILETLKNSPEIFTLVLSKSDRDSNPLSISDFWETVYDGLQVKISKYMNEKICYTAFCSVVAVQPLFSDERYKNLKMQCSAFFDKIARERIDGAYQKTYTINELKYFNIETFFFYTDYFKNFPDSYDTKKYVFSTTFELLSIKADKVLDNGLILLADTIYELALGYAQTEEDKILIANKRNLISDKVSILKEKKEKAEKKQKKKSNRALFLIDLSDAITTIFAIVFVIAIVSTVLFGLFSFIGIFKTFSKTAFIISLLVILIEFILVVLWDIFERLIQHFKSKK